MGIERRRYPRVYVRWPAIVNARHGSFEARTRNISEAGALIEFTEELDPGDDFQIAFKPSGDRCILATGERVWSANININGRETYSGMGIRFVKIPPVDRKYISALVSDHVKSR